MDAGPPAAPATHPPLSWRTRAHTARAIPVGARAYRGRDWSHTAQAPRATIHGTVEPTGHRVRRAARTLARQRRQRAHGTCGRGLRRAVPAPRPARAGDD